MKLKGESIGYCSNVHPGKDFSEYLDQLKTHSVEVRKKLGFKKMGIGLWFSNETASQLKTESDRQNLVQFLDDNGLFAYTINGFPFGNFHDDVVKHKVYSPDWTSVERLEYTKTVCDVFNELLVHNHRNVGSISTLPLGWPSGRSRDSTWADGARLEKCANNLEQVAIHLGDIEKKSGVRIKLAIEPEPGCVLQTGQQVVQFFHQYLFSKSSHNNDLIRRHVGVCHDVCHAAVMFEDQNQILDLYRDNEIGIYKLQISSAIEARLDDINNEISKDAVLTQLAQFAEDRYLHQACSMDKNGQTHFYEDLPLALERFRNEDIEQTVRVHYHVPIFLERFGVLGSTQVQILECLDWFRSSDQQPDIEVETYAWNVLPNELQFENLSDGIANEVRWLHGKLV